MSARRLLWWARRRVCNLLADQARGQGLTEYGLIISLISLFAIVGLFLFGSSLGSLLGNTSGGISACISSPLSSCNFP